MSDDAESDSTDSPICACDPSMLMRFSHAHERSPRSWGYTIEDERFAMDNDVHPERWKRTELAMAEGLTKLTKNLKQKTER